MTYFPIKYHPKVQLNCSTSIPTFNINILVKRTLHSSISNFKYFSANTIQACGKAVW